jgi:hypothetical protein
MRICTDHWAQLRARLAVGGLMGGCDSGHPEGPALYVNRAVFTRFMECAPPRALMGDVCPLCHVAAVGPDLDQAWMDDAIGDEREAQRQSMSSTVVH